MVLGIPLENFFMEVSGLYAILAILPLIILYLIRPKPKEQSIPSLMFFLKDLGSADRRSFFKRFTRDYLFIIQLLILVTLALALAKPFINVDEISLSETSVIIIDASASMQTAYDGKTRFEAAKEIALDNLAGTNTIIIARNLPLIAKVEVSSSEAREYIETLEPSSTSTGIYDATRSALDYIGKDTHVVVISDFIETEVDSDVNTVKKALQAKGAFVSFHSVASEANNIGITDLLVRDESTSVQVRNFYPETKEVNIKIGNIQEKLILKAGAADVFTFSTPSGVSKIELDVNDDFSLDDTAFISTPETTTVKVLVITNDENIEKSNLWVALNAIDLTTAYTIELEKAVPPRSINVNHDIVILKEFNQNIILPGIFRDIEKQIEEKGISLIVTPQASMFGFGPLTSLLPISFESENKVGSDIEVSDLEYDSTLTKDVNFGHVDYYFSTKLKSGARNIAFAKEDTSPIIALQTKGLGKIMYYGIFDRDFTIDGKVRRSTFKNDLFYPIFWKRTIDILTDTPSVETLNRQTGRVITLAKGEKVETPGGNTVEGIFMLDNQGIYSFKNQNFAANLLNSKESDVGGKFSEIDYEKADGEEIIRKRPKPLTSLFIGLCLLFLMLELIYTKMRGDM